MICGTRWRPSTTKLGFGGCRRDGCGRVPLANAAVHVHPPRRDATAGAYFYQPTTDRVSVSSYPDAWPPGRLAASPPPRSHLYTLTLIAHTHTHTCTHAYTRTHDTYNTTLSLHPLLSLCIPTMHQHPVCSSSLPAHGFYIVRVLFSGSDIPSLLHLMKQ